MTPPPASSLELTTISFLRRLPPGVALRHAASARWITAQAGETILDFEDASDDVFFVLQGCVRVVVRTPGGRELILDDIRAGQFFGEMAAIDGAPRSAAVTALHCSRICRMSGSAFMALLADAPDLARNLMRALVQRLRVSNARLLELTTLDIRHRIHSELLRSAGPPGPDGQRVISPPPVQQVLAQRIGARREAVSREMACMVREGLLERRRGALVLCQPDVLARGLAAALEA